MPTLLDDRLVADALTALTDWRGDAKRITRTVRVAGGGDDLLGEVKEAANALDHHPEVRRDGDQVTFTLWTHSEGGVTEYDIALASRIDDLIDQARGRGVTAGAVTSAGLGAGDVGTGLRQGGTTRQDVHVPQTPAETTEVGESLQPQTGDRLDPGVVAPAARHSVPATPLPDIAPDEPEPGIGRPEGQGTPPAGQNVGLPDDEGGPGDPR